MSLIPFSPARAGLIAEITFREAVRQRLLVMLILVATAVAASARFLTGLNFGSSESKFLVDMGMGALAFFGAILAIVGPVELFFGEIERRTVLTVLGKPVGRAEFVVGKLGGVLALLLVFCVTLTAMLIGLLWWSQARPAAIATAAADAQDVAYAGVALCGLLQWLKLGVLATLTLFLASYARSGLFATMTGFLVWIIGQIQYVVRDFYGLMDSAWARFGARILGAVVPDFQLFNVGDHVANGRLLTTGLVGGIALYALAYMVVYGCLAIYCFHHREL